MAKKLYLLALGLFLVIPFAAILGSTLATAINPEIAAHYANYVRNYRLLALAQGGVRLAALLAIMGLWFSTGFFLLKSKGRSYWWLLLSILGPFGFVPLTMLGDSAPARHDSHQRFSRRLNIYLRVGYELVVLVVVCVLASEFVDIKRDLMIRYESATTGVSIAQIVQLRDASGGMWAFGEGMEFLYLVVLLYLLWPICFAMIGRLLRPTPQSTGS